VVTQAGSVLLVETVRKTDLDQVMSQALAPWRKRPARPRPRQGSAEYRAGSRVGRGLPRGHRHAAVRAARVQPGRLRPTVSRLIDTLTASGGRALQADRSARSEVRSRVWALAGENAPDAADGQVTIDLDDTLVIAATRYQELYRLIAGRKDRGRRSRRDVDG
jgi:hypothetical protein